MAKNYDVNKDFMTVRQAMKEIGAKAPSTVQRMIEQKKLRAERIPIGWLVYRDSVREFLAAEASRSPTAGYPRGRARADEAPAPKRKPRKR